MTKLILSPKDNINKIELEGVETFAIEGRTLLVVFADGRTRNYPMEHLWYWQSEVPSGPSRSKPPGAQEQNEQDAGQQAMDSQILEDALLFRWIMDENGGGFVYEEANPEEEGAQYGMSSSSWGTFPGGRRAAIRKARAAQLSKKKDTDGAHR